MKIAVVGAGLAGLSCARALVSAGVSVTLFDKGRGAGGRLATRRVAGLQFDHGAQYLTARNPAFATLLREAGAAEWQPGWLVGVPGMSALPRALAKGLSIETGRLVTALEGGSGAWTVRHADVSGPFDAVAVTVPAPQVGALVGTLAPGLARRIEGVVMAPCWTLMAGFAMRLPLLDQVRPEAGTIGWAARDSAKPGRDATTECWVVQAGPAWSRAHLEEPPEAVVPLVLAALADLAGTPLPPPTHAAAHRWRYSLVEVPLGEPCLWDGTARLGLAGDWCLAGRAEAAFESGTALARAMLAG